MVEERASKKQQELLSFVDGFIKGNGYGPSYREVMRALDYKSVSTVAAHIEGLIAKGYLARRDNSARSLEVVTLRPGSQNGNAIAKTDSSIENQLIDIVTQAKLNAEDLERAVIVFKQLNLKKVSDAIKPAPQTKTAS